MASPVGDKHASVFLPGPHRQAGCSATDMQGPSLIQLKLSSNSLKEKVVFIVDIANFFVDKKLYVTLPMWKSKHDFAQFFLTDFNILHFYSLKLLEEEGVVVLHCFSSVL